MGPLPTPSVNYGIKGKNMRSKEGGGRATTVLAGREHLESGV